LLDEKINELKKTLIAYAELIQEMVEKSIKGLSEKNEPLLKEVIEKDEQRANEKNKKTREQSKVHHSGNRMLDDPQLGKSVGQQGGEAFSWILEAVLGFAHSPQPVS